MYIEKVGFCKINFSISMRLCADQITLNSMRHPMVNQSNSASPFSAKFVCKNTLRNDSNLCRVYGSLSRKKLQHL